MWDVYMLTVLNRAVKHVYMGGEEFSHRIEDGFVVVDTTPVKLWPGEFVDGIVECAEEVINGDTEFRDREEEIGDTLPTDMSDTSESEPEKHNNKGEDGKCTAPHEGKLLFQDEFPFTIDQLFTMIFTNSKFNLELLAARGATDYVQAPWQPQNGLKCRQVKYTLNLTAGPMGPKDVQVTETQVINKCSRPGAVYSIDCTSDNAGIPYADYFSVQAHYCLERREAGASLALYGGVHYKKSMWPLVKGFLEKNAISGLEDFGRELTSRLRAAARPAPAAAARGHPRRRRRRDGGYQPRPHSHYTPHYTLHSHTTHHITRYPQQAPA
ncbi:unnamed protein product [Euphydryas editha]|uniref:VASt domain-containing protein n=1 Tax=Euphydryas editha TaxID=104508 RepID=A0AAU9TG40_EUPED|nr:unnamed protein product [Euphydryas editha]